DAAARRHAGARGADAHRGPAAERGAEGDRPAALLLRRAARDWNRAMTSPAITAVRWRPFRLPMRARFEAATGPLDAREGVLVELVGADGLRGVGEASPLPALGAGTDEDVLALLEAHGAALTQPGAGDAL